MASSLYRSHSDVGIFFWVENSFAGGVLAVLSGGTSILLGIGARMQRDVTFMPTSARAAKV
jgi:hypothetical protein